MSAISSVTTTTMTSLESVWASVGAEAILLMCFAFGFLIFNSKTFQSFTNPKKSNALIEKQIAAHHSSGNHEDAVNAAKGMSIGSFEVLEMLVSSLAELGRNDEILTLVKKHSSLASELAPAVLSALSSNQALLKEACTWLTQCGSKTEQASEAIVNALVQAGELSSAQSLLRSGVPAGPRTFVVILKATIASCDLEAALLLVQDMSKAGFFLPTHLTTQLMQLGSKYGRVKDVMSMFENIGISTEALTGIVEYFCRDGDLSMVETMIESQQGNLQYGAYDAVMKAFAKKNDTRAFKYFDMLMEAGLLLQEQTVVAVLTYCVEGRNVALAEHVFAAARKGASATLGVYSALVRVYAATRLYSKTCELVNLIQEDGLEPDTVMYGGLIKAAVESGRLDLSRTLLRKSGTMDIQNYMSLFRACGRERNVKKVLELLKELEDSTVGIDTTAYNCVLDVCIKAGDSRSAADLFTKMKVRGYVDVISYNTLLKGMGGGATGLTDSHMILKEMRDLGLCPNQITFNSLINYAIRERDITGAWSFIKEMEQDGITIDNFTCSIMCKGLKHASGKDELDRTLDLIERSGVVPDEVLVNTLLDVCIRLRDVKRLQSALKTFRHSGVTPSEHAYGTVLRAYGHARAIDEAQATWEDMLDRKVRPSDQTIGSMVDACVTNGAPAEAWKAVQDVRATGLQMKSPLVFYTTIIKSFAQRKDMTRAIEVYDEMKSTNIRLSAVTFNMLIDLCARSGDVERASALFRDMCAMDVTPDVITYTTIIKGYCVQGDLEQAIQLFTLMRKKNIQPDAMLFNAIIDGCARKQMTSLVEMMLTDMESSGIAPTNQTLTILVKLHGKNSDLDTAFAYADAMPTKYGFEANAQVYSALMQACVNAGHLEKGLEVFKRVRNPDAKAYATLINGYLKHNDVQGAIRLLESALGARVSIEQELVDNVLFMAGRRKLSTDSLNQRLRGAGLNNSGRTERPSTPPGLAAERAMPRRMQGQAWRN